MINFPNCKINIGLYVTEKRADGYHNIESCFVPIPIHDSLEIVTASDFSLEVSGLAIPGNSQDNLIFKAYQLLKADFDIPPVQVFLDKNIPMGAGLGGGSSDGTHMLLLLNEKFQLGLSHAQLAAYALQLGSDCPFFLENRPVIATGRGEVFEEIDLNLSSYTLVLIHPGIHVGTGMAYQSLSPKKPIHSLKQILESPIEKWKYLVQNDFERFVFTQHPEVKQVKDQLYDQGAVFASMSGSGSAVFGLFSTPPKLSFSKKYLQKVVSLVAN